MKHLTRRNFLTGLGLGAGAALFAPFFRQLEAEANNELPCRFVFFVEGNGLWPRLFHDPVTRAALQDGDPERVINNARQYTNESPLVTTQAPLDQALSLGALAGDEERISLVEHSATVFGLSSKIAGGGHTSGLAALSCQRHANGPSIDAWLAQNVAGDVPFSAMRVGIAESLSTRLNYSLCTFSAKNIAPVYISPTEAFYTYFGSVAQGSGLRKFTQRRQLLEFSRSSASRSLNAFSGSSQERRKLERYLASIETMLTRHGHLESLSGPGSALEQAKQFYLSLEPDTSYEDGALYSSPYMFDRLQAQVDMVTAGLIGGLTQVAVVSCAAGNDWAARYPELMTAHGLQANASAHDGLRHVAGNGTDLENAAVRVLTDATSHQVGAMAYMARQLASVPEGDGTMLDRTVLVYLSDNGEMHHSNAEEWASLLIGGSGLGLRTDGRSVVYPKIGRANHRQVSNLFNTLGHAAGLDLNTFGGESEEQRVAAGPLSELLA